MKIRNVELFQIETPRHYQMLPGFEQPFSGHLIVKLYVDDGPIGLGEASDSKAKDVASIAAQYNELLRGRDARRITEVHGSSRELADPRRLRLTRRRGQGCLGQLCG